MAVEARYAPGDALLIGSGNHWLLLGEPAVTATTTPEQTLVDKLWRLLGEGSPALEKVLDLLGANYPTGMPSLVLIDATPGRELTAVHGSGSLKRSGNVWVLAVTEDPGEPNPWPRLTGGIVTAGAAWLNPVASRTFGPEGGLEAPPAHGALIDGVPPHILAAAAPERHFDPGKALGSSVEDSEATARSARTVEPRGHRQATPPAVVPPTPEQRPAAGVSAPVPDTQGMDGDDTINAPPLLSQEVAALGDLDPGLALDPSVALDEDGHTSYRPARLLREQGGTEPEPSAISGLTGETVLAVYCPGGHITTAFADICRVCHAPVPAQEPRRVPRPALGVLRLPSGEAVPLDRGVVLGRKPHAIGGDEEFPHLVHLPADSTYLSRMHLQITLDGWLVLATDLGSQGGTRLRTPDREPIWMTPREPYVLENGHCLDLADVYAVTFEVQA